MLSSLEITGFRQYDYFKIEGLNKINFILGDNNVGKTSILEAVFAWSCGQNIVPFMNIPLARGRYSGVKNPYWVMEEILACVKDRKAIPLKMIFSGTESNGIINTFTHTIHAADILTDYTPVGSSSILAKWDVEYKDSVVTNNITLPYTSVSEVRPHKLAKYIDVLSHTATSENTQIYASLKREGFLDEVIEEMKVVFPEIVGIDMIPYPDGSQAPISVKKSDNTMLPMYAFGDGIQKWFYVLGAMSLYKNSIICIDEVDSGFHPKAQIDFCKNMVGCAVRNGVQLFATTHNIEFVDNMIEALYADEDLKASVNIYTMKETDNGVRIRNLDLNEAVKLRTDYNMELR